MSNVKKYSVNLFFRKLVQKDIIEIGNVSNAEKKSMEALPKRRIDIYINYQKRIDTMK